jgi:hypothetical protein
LTWNQLGAGKLERLHHPQRIVLLDVVRAYRRVSERIAGQRLQDGRLQRLLRAPGRLGTDSRLRHAALAQEVPNHFALSLIAETRRAAARHARGSALLPPRGRRVPRCINDVLFGTGMACKRSTNRGYWAGLGWIVPIQSGSGLPRAARLRYPTWVGMKFMWQSLVRIPTMSMKQPGWRAVELPLWN